MPAIKSSYNALVPPLSAPSSSIKPTWSRSKATLKKAWQRRMKQHPEEIASKTRPTESGECLTSGAVYKHESDLLAERGIYKQGVSPVSNDEAQHTQLLQKEMRSFSVLLRQRNQQLNLIPNEIWEMVFSYLEYQDLQQCARVYRTWSNICLNKPDFLNLWHTRLEPHGRLSHLCCKSSMIKIGRPKSSLLGTSDYWWLRDLFTMLQWWSNNTFKTLDFASICITSPLAHCIAQMLRSIHPPFKEVIFRSSTRIASSDAMHILQSCSRTERVAFSSKFNCSDKPVIFRDNDLSAITSLELAFCDFDGRQNDLILNVISRCPNLMDLSLAFGPKVSCSDFVLRAFTYCHRLMALNIGCVPGTRSNEWAARFGGNQSSIETPTPYGSATSRGLSTLKYSSIGARYGDFQLIVDKSYNSLESLYIYDYYQDVSHTNLRPLILHPLPNLRKVHFRLYKTNAQHRVVAPSSALLQDLTDFFSGNVCLEEVVLDFGGHCISYCDPGMKANKLLLTISKNCRLLRQLAIIGPLRYSGDMMLQFAATASPSITHLEICMYWQNAVELAQKLATLLYFRLSDVCYDAYDHNDSTFYPESSWLCIDAIERIMKQRNQLCI